MDFVAVVDQVIALLRQRGRVAYRTLKRQFQLDDEALDDLKIELIDSQRLATDEQGTVLVWTGAAETPPRGPVGTAVSEGAQPPLAYTPPYLAEKILTSKSALEGERKQVTVLFADLRGSLELLADRDPEEARQLLDPVLERMIAAAHRYEGTVNQIMGDGIMALFGAPIAHEDHAVRACYAALAMQEALRAYGDQVRQSHQVEIHIRVGLNSGEVVVRAIGNDLHMDYSAIGQTTHLAARMEQLAMPGSILLTALTEGSVEVRHFEEGYYTHPEIVALMQKVQVQVGNEPEHQQAGPGMPTAVVEVDLHSGATLRMKQGFNAARTAYLRTDQGQDEKLRPMAEALLPKAQTDALFQSLRTLEQQRDIRDVLALTIAPKGKR